MSYHLMSECPQLYRCIRQGRSSRFFINIVPGKTMKGFGLQVAGTGFTKYYGAEPAGPDGVDTYLFLTKGDHKQLSTVTPLDVMEHCAVEIIITAGVPGMVPAMRMGLYQQ